MAKITTNITDNYLDSTTDKLQDAREEIKSLIEAQNAIQDKFDVTAVQENQVLQANTDGVFTNQTLESSGPTEQTTTITFNSTGSYVGSTSPKTSSATINSVSNPSGVITQDGSNYTLASGTYFGYTETDIAGFSTANPIWIRLKIGGSVKVQERYAGINDIGLNGESGTADSMLISKMANVFTTSSGLITLDVVSINSVSGIASTPSFTPPKIVLVKLA